VVTSIWILYKAGNFLISWATISFSRRTLIYGVNLMGTKLRSSSLYQVVTLLTELSWSQ